MGGILIGIYVAYLAIRIMIQAAHELVDRSLPKRVLEELDVLIRTHDPRVLSYHELRTRKVGGKTFIDFHLVMQPEQSFQQAHEITESLIQKIRTRIPSADVTIHEDPKGGM